MRRYAKLQDGPAGGFSGASARSGGGDGTTKGGDGGGGGGGAQHTYSVRCLAQLEDLMGCSLRLEDSELDEFVPEFMVTADRAAEVRKGGRPHACVHVRVHKTRTIVI
jgi:hypothetical protein